MTDLVQISTTTDSREEADRIARGSVRERLAACAQISGPIESTYWWNGRVETAAEFLVVAKTTADRAAVLVEYIVSVHSYDRPEVITVPIVGGNREYLEWVRQECTG
jgi:periplasmic divalent cation tolerance protein